MYKKGKFWVVATVATASVFLGKTVVADEVVDSTVMNQESDSVQVDTSIAFSFTDTEVAKTKEPTHSLSKPANIKTMQEPTTRMPIW